MLASLNQLIRQNLIVNGKARVTFFDQSPGKLWSVRSENGVACLIATAETTTLSNIKLTISELRINETSPLAKIKSGNYLEKLLERENAEKLGFNEAIQLNMKNEVVSALMANIFWVKDGMLFTPSLTTGCLPGTTRAFLVENVEVREVNADIVEIENADEIFLTSAGYGLCLCADSKGSAVFQKLRELYDSHTKIGR